MVRAATGTTDLVGAATTAAAVMGGEPLLVVVTVVTTFFFDAMGTDTTVGADDDDDVGPREVASDLLTAEAPLPPFGAAATTAVVVAALELGVVEVAGVGVVVLILGLGLEAPMLVNTAAVCLPRLSAARFSLNRPTISVSRTSWMEESK